MINLVVAVFINFFQYIKKGQIYFTVSLYLLWKKQQMMHNYMQLTLNQTLILTLTI